VSKQCLSQRKEAIAGVGRALAKVTTFALENPEAAVRLMWRHEPCTHPPASELDRVLRRDLAIMKARLSSFRIDPGDRDQRWGAIEGTEISAWQDFLMASGAITQRLDPASVYTNELVDRFNRFDARRIKDDARAYGKQQAQS